MKKKKKRETIYMKEIRFIKKIQMKIKKNVLNFGKTLLEKILSSKMNY